MEPYSSSVEKVSTFLIATSTKICTRGRSSPAHAVGLQRFFSKKLPSAPLYTCSHACLDPLRARPSIGNPLKRDPFSGLIDSAGKSLHTSWLMPTSVATARLSSSINAF